MCKHSSKTSRREKSASAAKMVIFIKFYKNKIKFRKIYIYVIYNYVRIHSRMHQIASCLIKLPRKACPESLNNVLQYLLFS